VAQLPLEPVFISPKSPNPAASPPFLRCFSLQTIKVCCGKAPWTAGKAARLQPFFRYKSRLWGITISREEKHMITLTKLNKEEFVLNCDLIETIQENPDTTIRLTNGNIYIVRETMQDVVDLTVRYKRSWFTGLRWQEGNKA